MTHSPETIDKFIRLVAVMRAKQRNLLGDRSQVSFVMAKSAERHVDGWLNHLAELERSEQDPELLQASLIKDVER